MTKSKTLDPTDGIPVDQLTYEQAFNELETIVARLEANEHALDEAMSLFERGQVLAHYCAILLEQAELKIQQLSGSDLIDFDPQA